MWLQVASQEIILLILLTNRALLANSQLVPARVAASAPELMLRHTTQPTLVSSLPSKFDAFHFMSPLLTGTHTSLPESIKDSRLEAEVTRAFSEFGTVFVKIRRDHKNMPFAFCQFTVSCDVDLCR